MVAVAAKITVDPYRVFFGNDYNVSLAGALQLVPYFQVGYITRREHGLVFVYRGEVEYFLDNGVHGFITDFDEANSAVYKALGNIVSKLYLDLRPAK